MEERVGKAKGGSVGKGLTKAERKLEPISQGLGKPSGIKEGLRKAPQSEPMNRKTAFKNGGCVQIKGWGKARRR